MSDNNQQNRDNDLHPGLIKRTVKWLLLVLLGLIIIILILGLIPVSTNELSSQSDPASSYQEAIQRFEGIQQVEAPIVNDASGSLLLTHGDKTEEVFVLIHGITNSPLQWEELGKHLHEQGHNVLILRMPHHGLQSHNVSELKVLSAEALREYADEAVDIAAGLGDEMTVIGISGGGTVTSWIAQNRSEVGQALLLSPFYGPPQLPPFLDTFLMNLASRVPNISFQNPAEPQRDWVYRGEATRGVAAFMRFGRNVLGMAENELPAADTIYIVTTAVDDTADNDYAVELAKLWSNAGADVSSFEFAASSDIPHNSVDPAADSKKKALVYAKILEMLGEEAFQGNES